jgi:hypothetical protein
MDQRPPRKRIPPATPGVPAVEDPCAYVSNKCSLRAKKIGTIKPNFDINIWFDQHYQNRTQFGDEQGARIGIESEKVESLVRRSMNHLITYSSMLKTFAFVNSGNSRGRNERIVLQEETPDGLLHVVIEVHLIEIGTYEVTVKTAMCSPDFSLSDGQYLIQIIDNQSSIKKMERRRLIEVCALE